MEELPKQKPNLDLPSEAHLLTHPTCLNCKYAAVRRSQQKSIYEQRQHSKTTFWDNQDRKILAVTVILTGTRRFDCVSGRCERKTDWIGLVT